MLRASAILTLIALHLALGTAASAQSTRAKGRVTDSDTGEGIPFVGVFFKGTTIGVSTDLDGYYTIETRDSSATVLCASILGYETAESPVKRSSYNSIDFRLKMTSDALDAVVVKPDNRYMKWILSQIDANRHRNDPERRDAYSCDIYTKTELDLTNADEQIRNRMIRKNFGFVFDYMDTSVVSGRPYLPIMISENRSRRYHSKNPDVDREIIEASRVSGLNEENALLQFTGSMHLKTNFYNNFIDAFNIQIPSPLSPNGEVYYNYFLIDSLDIDGRKTWKIRFHPGKYVSSSVFDGEMAIDAQDFAMREMHVKLRKGANVNWIRDIVIDRVDRRVDSLWFYCQDKLYVDFSVTMNDSSKLASFIGNRQIDYLNPKLGADAQRLHANPEPPVTVFKDAGRKSDQWWDAARPYQLSEKEKNIYLMVDSIKNVPLYNNIYNLVNTFISGYFQTKYIGFGPYSSIYSFNKLEGHRFAMGLRTTADFSRKIRLTTYLAYGTKDREFKGGNTIEWMISRYPTKKLTLSARKDIRQLGRSSSAFNETNILSSLLTKKNSEKRSPVNDYSLTYERELAPWLNTSTSLQFQRIFANSYVPMLRVDSSPRPDGSLGRDTIAINSIGSNNVHFEARFSKNETVDRGVFNKSYLHTKFPVVILDLTGSLKGIGKNEYSYFRSEMLMKYKLRLPPVGASDIRFSVGNIVGRVPYPMLKLFEGNGTYIHDRNAFSCMEFYEFAADTWTTLFWEHDFGGFFLGKIPLIKKLHWREIASLKAAYGTLTEKNNGIIGSATSADAPMLFPFGMYSLNKPYVEMSAGVSNIFRLVRVDCAWRMTHRYLELPDGVRKRSPRCFTVTIGLEMKF